MKEDKREWVKCRKCGVWITKRKNPVHNEPICCTCLWGIEE